MSKVNKPSSATNTPSNAKTKASVQKSRPESAPAHRSLNSKDKKGDKSVMTKEELEKHVSRLAQPRKTEANGLPSTAFTFKPNISEFAEGIEIGSFKQRLEKYLQDFKKRLDPAPTLSSECTFRPSVNRRSQSARRGEATPKSRSLTGEEAKDDKAQTARDDKDFVTRMKDDWAMREQKRKSMAAAPEPFTFKPTIHAKKKAETQYSFLERVQMDLDSRQELEKTKLKQKEEDETKLCTFQPSISTVTKSLKLPDFVSRMEDDVEERRAKAKRRLKMLGVPT